MLINNLSETPPATLLLLCFDHGRSGVSAPTVDYAVVHSRRCAVIVGESSSAQSGLVEAEFVHTNATRGHVDIVPS